MSCHVNKKLAYFKDVPDSLVVPKSVEAAKFTDPKIQPNDIVQVSIITLDPAINTMLNSDNTTSFAVSPGAASAPVASQPVNGFLVDKEGNIELPIIGKVKISGLTTAEARDSIHNKVAIYYKQPVVNVRFTNFTITVLGEVVKPSTYIVPNEKVSILDALGMAGDLTIFGRRENVLLIRDSVGQKKFVRFDLNSSKIINSPYFYLQQGDMVYVEPNRAKAASTDAIRTRNFALIASLITVFVTIVSKL